MPLVKCQTCNNEFHAKPSWIKNGYGKYCCKKCSHEGTRNGKMMKCFICKKEVYKQQKAIARSQSAKFFCGKSCQTIWRNSIVNVGINHPNWKGGKHVAYRNILQKSNIPKVCILCGNIDGRVLAVHHVDENHKNNELKNLVWMCHNCHVLIHNYKIEKDRFLKIIR